MADPAHHDVAAPAPARERGAGGIGIARSRSLWRWILAIGALAWVLSVLVTALTDDTILVPTVLMLGSFLVPVAAVTFALSHATRGEAPVDVLVVGFLAGGTVGLPASALTEVYLLPSTYGTFVTVGLIEEGAKGIVLVAVARWMPVRSVRDGMVLGATVGAGFAAFESTGYALKAMVDHGTEREILSIVETELARAVLAPFGHITWTALLGGAVFASAAATGRFRLTPRVAATFAGVVLLHGAWDATYGWAITISQGIAGPGWNLAWPDTAAWAGTPTGRELTAFDITYSAMIALNAALGSWWVVRCRRGSRTITRAGS